MKNIRTTLKNLFFGDSRFGHYMELVLTGGIILLFGTSGIKKLGEAEEFSRNISGFQLPLGVLTDLVAVALPPVEIACAFLLVF